MKNKALWLIPFALWLAGCGERPRETNPVGSVQPVSVQTVTVKQVPWPSLYEATGTVRARTSAVIAAKLMGYVREVTRGLATFQAIDKYPYDERRKARGRQHAIAELAIDHSVPDLLSFVRRVERRRGERILEVIYQG